MATKPGRDATTRGEIALLVPLGDEFSLARRFNSPSFGRVVWILQHHLSK